MPITRQLDLRTKFGLLALVYGVAIALNLLIACLCIVLFFRSAFIEPDLAAPEIPVTFTTVEELFDLPENATTATAAAYQKRILAILGFNAALGLGFALLGLMMVRRWVLRPVATIRSAARQLARGNLHYRIPARQDDELGRLAAEINQMATTLQEVQQQAIERERLAATGELADLLSERIGQGLQQIRTLTDELTAAATNPEIAEFQVRVVSTIERFDHWLQDLRASVAPVTLGICPVPVPAVLASVSAALQPMLNQKGVRLVTECDPGIGPVPLDRAFFEQAVIALCTNAIQASTTGQAVRVSASLQSKEERWRISVQDSGAGIAPELQEKIFLPHFTTSRDGHGIGLPMAQHIIRLHGGQLSVTSMPGNGTTFVSDLPLRLPPTNSSS